MKFVHLSDLHLGKRLNEFSLIDDQKFILNKIIDIIVDENPDGIIIAGDIYDKAVPSAESVTLFDDFLSRLAEMRKHVFVISGNHDSPERIAFGSKIMGNMGIHLSAVYSGTVEQIILNDEFGELGVCMLPFVKPANVRRYSDDEIVSYTDAVNTALKSLSLDSARRNILITHQFVTGASRSASEEISVGGTDNVDVSIFDAFDYVALGHIHSPQNCGSERIRYCGTPLKYSFSEAKDRKSVTVVELKEKGSIYLRTVELKPLHDMVELRGTYDKLVSKSFYENTSWQEDYTHITLTDEEDIPDAIGKLRTIYHNLMKLDYDNTRTRTNACIEAVTDFEAKSPLQFFADFYYAMNNQNMSTEQSEFMEQLISSTTEA